MGQTLRNFYAWVWKWMGILWGYGVDIMQWVLNHTLGLIPGMKEIDHSMATGALIGAILLGAGALLLWKKLFEK